MGVTTYLSPKIKPNSKIYRYFNLEKFEWLIKKSALHFTRLDKFEDPFEGLITQQQFTGFEHNEYVLERGEHNARNFIHYGRPFIALSCWSRNNESMPMWNSYAKNGVVIESTVDALQKAIASNQLDGTQHIVDVKYEKYTKPIINWPNDDRNIKVGLAFYKGVSYKDEREIRAVLKKPVPKGKITPMELEQKAYPSAGIDVPVDLSQVIKKIIVYPFASHWLVPAVEGILNKYSRNNFVNLISTSSLEAAYKDVIKFTGDFNAVDKEIR